jgi:diguanylate cyclase (GGDEF)-like protein
MSASASQLEEVRLRIINRLAALLQNQTRTTIFSQNLSRLVMITQQEIMQDLKKVLAMSGDSPVTPILQEILKENEGLNQCMHLLIRERNQQWHKSGNDLQSLLNEFNTLLTQLNSTLIEKDLLERQSRILEQIILSHENVTQWKEFVKSILTDFHEIFPFNFFYIAFAEDKKLSLNLYFLGEYDEDTKKHARVLLTNQLIASLDLPMDAPMEVEEFTIARGKTINRFNDVRLITVAVPEHTPKLAGLLGVAYASSSMLSAQEESVIRSILAIMVMLVGSSKALSRTLSELEYYSTHDALTGLYNRRHFNAMLDYEIGRSRRHQHEFSVLLIDLDDFKDINDTYGHLSGDNALRGIAETLRSQLRKGDLACRIGGDEFVVLLPETGRAGAEKVASNIGTAIRSKPFEAENGKNFHLTVSIGSVTYPRDSENFTDILSCVDMAMYRAKELGKDSAISANTLGQESIHAHRITRDLTEKLRAALEDNRIQPFYQPIIDCSTGELFAYEALARLVEPNGDLFVAGSFINIIEKYSLGRRLDRAIIDSALHYKNRIRKTGDIRTKLFINLSAQEIQNRGILTYVEELCEELSLPPSCIVFEILERDAINDISNMRKFLSNLRARGFAFALDDFGSGYNSFHYLRELRFDYVKIDGTFVSNILNSRIDFALVQNLSNLCQDIGISTVAEFVEDQETLDALKSIGINYAQGYFIGVPQSTMQPFNIQTLA